MPRGVPAAGYRKTKHFQKRVEAGLIPNTMEDKNKQEIFETDEEIDARIQDRFDVLEQLTQAALSGDARSVIVSGPAGLGKSFTVERQLKEWDPDGRNHTFIKGHVRPTGLLRLLHQYSRPGQVIVFDDADSIFYDDVCLNMLKAVCDTTDQRTVSYLVEMKMSDEDGNTIPRQFLFEGTIIFITNIDFMDQVNKGGKLAPHFEALLSRSHYIDLAIKTTRDRIVRLKQVVYNSAMLAGFEPIEYDDMMNFIEENSTVFRDLSLRLLIKLSHLYRISSNWKTMALVTLGK